MFYSTQLFDQNTKLITICTANLDLFFNLSCSNAHTFFPPPGRQFPYVYKMGHGTDTCSFQNTCQNRVIFVPKSTRRKSNILCSQFIQNLSTHTTFCPLCNTQMVDLMNLKNVINPKFSSFIHHIIDSLGFRNISN